MPKETDSPKNNGIAPEYWYLLTTEPQFGSLISLDDINARGVVEGRDDNLIEESTKMTSVGEAEFCFTKTGFDIYVESLGTNLFYNNKGSLVAAEINLVDFCVGDYDDDLEGETMGDKSSEMIDYWLALKESQINVHFDFEENSITLVCVDNTTGESVVMDSSKDEDIFMSNEPTIFRLEGYTMHITRYVCDGVFYFGVYTTVNGEQYTSEMIKNYIKCSSDCNYQTFMESDSPDRYEKLVKRVFVELGEGMTGDELLPGDGGLT